MPFVQMAAIKIHKTAYRMLFTILLTFVKINYLRWNIRWHMVEAIM